MGRRPVQRRAHHTELRDVLALRGDALCCMGFGVIELFWKGRPGRADRIKGSPNADPFRRCRNVLHRGGADDLLHLARTVTRSG